MSSSRETSDPTTGTAPLHRMAGQGRIGLLGLLAVQGILGYEWLVSGLAKIFGGFVPQFGTELPDVSQAAPEWFKAILTAVVLPAPAFWAATIVIAETLLGIALIGAAALWAWRLDRLPRLAHILLVVLTAIASISATVLAITLHILNGASHPWLLPGDPFDEGIDLDSLLPAIQLVIFFVSVALLRQMRKQSPPDGAVDSHSR